jgi:hypothetical protein
MSSGDIPPEVRPLSSGDTGLHSFVKLAIAYIGILGLTLISVLFVVTIIGDGKAVSSLSGYSDYLAIYYVVLIPLMLIAIDQLRKGKKLGAYLAYASMAIHHSLYFSDTLYLVFLLSMSVVVGILLLRSFKHLH